MHSAPVRGNHEIANCTKSRAWAPSPSGHGLLCPRRRRWRKPIHAEPQRGSDVGALRVPWRACDGPALARRRVGIRSPDHIRSAGPCALSSCTGAKPQANPGEEGYEMTFKALFDQGGFVEADMAEMEIRVLGDAIAATSTVAAAGRLDPCTLLDSWRKLVGPVARTRLSAEEKARQQGMPPRPPMQQVAAVTPDFCTLPKPSSMTQHLRPMPWCGAWPATITIGPFRPAMAVKGTGPTIRHHIGTQ